jgi:hypothetical protein
VLEILRIAFCKIRAVLERVTDVSPQNDRWKDSSGFEERKGHQ